MAEKEIIIPITLVASGDSAESGVGTSTDNNQPQNEQDKKDKKAGKDAGAAENPAKAILTKAIGETLSLALNNFGDITGDYVAGQNLQTAVSEGTKLVSAISMGPAGIAVYAIDKGVQAFNYFSSIKKSDKQAAFAQKRIYGTTMKC